MARTDDYSSETTFSVEDILSEYRYGSVKNEPDTDIQSQDEVVFSATEEEFSSSETQRSGKEGKSPAKARGLRNPLAGVDFKAIKDKLPKVGRSKKSDTDDYLDDFDYPSPAKHTSTPASHSDTSYGVKPGKLQMDDLRKEIESQDIDLSQFDAYYTVDRKVSDNSDDGFAVTGASFSKSAYIDLSREEVSTPVHEIDINTDELMNSASEDDNSEIAESSIPVQAADYSGEKKSYSENRDSSPAKLLSGFTARFSKKKEYTEDYLDDDAEDGYGRYSEDDKRFSTSDFKSYLATVSTQISYKLIGMGEALFTQDEDKEDLGEEVNFKSAQKHYYRIASPLGARLKVSSILILIMTWISIGLPVTGMLKSNRTASAVCLGFQLVLMLLSLDIVTETITKLFRRIIGFETLVLAANIITIIDAVTIVSSKSGGSHLSLNFLAAISLWGLQISEFLYSRALWKSIRVPGISHKDSSYTVTAEYTRENHEISLLKSEKPFKGFIRRSEEKSPDENMYSKLAVFILIGAAVLTLILTAAKKDFKDIFYFCSLILCPAVPFCGLLCFAVPYFAGAFKMFPKAAAVAGWSGVYDIGHSKNIIITGKDLFPSDHIEISDIKISKNADVNKTIAYAGSLLIASGNCLAKPFYDYMRAYGIRSCIVNDFTPLEGGGFKGIIDQQIVYCGSSNFMRLQGIKIPTRRVSHTSILISVNGVVHGVFEINYKPSREIRESLAELISSDHHPIFAVKDFNITPDMLREKYDLATDGYDFPPFTERFEISRPKENDNSVIAAVVCREGLSSFVEMTSTVSRIFNTTKFNLYVTIIGSLTAALIVFLMMLIQGAVSTLSLFVITAVLAAPVLIRSLFIKF